MYTYKYICIYTSMETVLLSEVCAFCWDSEFFGARV